MSYPGPASPEKVSNAVGGLHEAMHGDCSPVMATLGGWDRRNVSSRSVVLHLETPTPNMEEKGEEEKEERCPARLAECLPQKDAALG